MKPNHIICLLLLLTACARPPEGVPVPEITIARDQWGVPHIMAPTDAQVAYGLAWVQCEDDFVTLQEQMLALRGQLGEVKGKEGIKIDFGVAFMGLRETVNARYEQEVSGEFREYLEGFVAGANQYAALHPEEVLLADLFPLHGKDIIMGYLLGMMEITGAGKDLLKIMDGRIWAEVDANFPKGSNAIAVSNRKTADSTTYLAINSHQPLEGWYSWYEAHLISDEGLNILGGTFPGGICIFHGTNEYLGWAHTVNHADFSDVYKLRMHPDRPLYYYFDGEWLELKEMHYRSWLKLLGPLKIPINRTIYQSRYGPTFETDDGFFSWRFVADKGLRAAEQWYRMNKARDLKSFRAALDIQGIPSTNIVYADRAGNIFFISNGKLPKRNPAYRWREVLPGDTSATLWTEDFYPLDSLPQVLNPVSGFLFNTNHSPYVCTDSTNNPQEGIANRSMGFQAPRLLNNRSTRFLELIREYDRLTYEQFKAIKFDIQYPSQLTDPRMLNLEQLLQLDARRYPDIADAIRLLKNWDRRTGIDNTTAPLFILSLKTLISDLKEQQRYRRGNKITEADCVRAIMVARRELLEHYQSLQVPLGQMQRHTRGPINLPLSGGPDVLAAMHSKAIGNGQYRGEAGESYIQLVRFGRAGVEIESIHAYGSSAEADSPHYNDQMEYFTQKRLKKMSLDREEVLKNAVRTYSPMRVRGQ